MGFEWRIITSSFKEQWDSSETAILLQIIQWRIHGSLSPELPRGILLRGEKYQQMSSCPKLSIVRAKFQENVSKNRGPLLLLPSLHLWDGDFTLGMIPLRIWGPWISLLLFVGARIPCQGRKTENIWDHCHHLLSIQFQKRAGRCYSDVCKYSCPKHTAKDQRFALGEVVQIPP